MESSLSERLVHWYMEHRRDLAFRRTRDPYAILVAEVLLQRTRVAAGHPYYERFLARFPTVADLAGASEEEVLKAWEGLGFYGRARNLHRAAKAIVAEHNAKIPRSSGELRALPGVGEYTAGAVSSIAFGERVPAIDGNVARVLARVFRISGDVGRGDAHRRLAGIAATLVPEADPGTYNQALMELGATVCRPRAPLCPACPVRDICGAYAGGDPEAFPRRTARATVPVVRVVFALVERDGKVLLVRRPAGGLLAGLWGFPGGELPPRGTDRGVLRSLLRGLGLSSRRMGVAGPVEHTFSHRRWRGTVYRVEASGSRVPEGAVWAGADELGRLPIVPFHRRFLEARARRDPGPPSPQ